MTASQNLLVVLSAGCAEEVLTNTVLRTVYSSPLLILHKHAGSFAIPDASALGWISHTVTPGFIHRRSLL